MYAIAFTEYKFMLDSHETNIKFYNYQLSNEHSLKSPRTYFLQIGRANKALKILNFIVAVPSSSRGHWVSWTGIFHSPQSLFKIGHEDLLPKSFRDHGT
jgi:hypothetical protein